MEDFRTSTRHFIIDNFLFGDDTGLNDQTSLLANGIVDSMGILELVHFISKEFQITVATEELLPENLDSIDNIARYLSHKLQSAANA